ncbi:MAG: hypothetical protein U7M05_09860 [Candidatus Igneacidithiobacillus chanchocoensis]
MCGALQQRVNSYSHAIVEGALRYEILIHWIGAHRQRLTDVEMPVPTSR